MTTEQFASWLLTVHADAFGPQSLGAVFYVKETASTASVEWFIFGTWAIQKAVAGNISDARVVKATLDSFYHQLYSGLVASGTDNEVVKGLSAGVQVRSAEYHQAFADETPPGPVFNLGLAVCDKIVPSQKELEWLVAYSGVIADHVGKVAGAIKKKLSDTRVVDR